MLQTIGKLGPVLDLFTIERPEWGVAEAADALDVPRSSAHELLASLSGIGLLQSNGRGRYRIGWRIVELSETLRGTVDVRAHANPVMQKLVDSFGETTHLAVMERGKALYIDKIVGNHQINVMGARVGAQLEPHCSGVGKVLLAYCDTEEVARIINNRSLRRLTSSTITDPATLFTELRKVRAAGCAFDEGEAVTEVHCVAAPIKDEMGTVIAALSMTVPASRFLPRRAELKRAIITAATDISSRVARAGDAQVTLARDDPAQSPPGA